MNSRSGWRAGALAAGLLVCVAPTTGCSPPATAGASAAGGGAESSRPTGGSPQQQATQAERALLGTFASTPGVSGVVGRATFGSDQASESWHVNAASATAFTAAAARLPHWPRLGSGARTGPDHGQYSEMARISGSGTLAVQTVTLIVMPDGAGASTLQVTAEVDYRPVKPPAERIADSSVLTVKLLPVPGFGQPEWSGKAAAAHTGERVVTSASTIARIAADINALPAMPPYVAFCPATRGSTTLSLAFAPSPDAPDSASTIVKVPEQPAGFCAPGVQVTIDATVEPELDNSVHAGLFAQIEQLAGVG